MNGFFLHHWGFENYFNWNNFELCQWRCIYLFQLCLRKKKMRLYTLYCIDRAKRNVLFSASCCRFDQAWVLYGWLLHLSSSVTWKIPVLSKMGTRQQNDIKHCEKLLYAPKASTGKHYKTPNLQWTCCDGCCFHQ